MKSTRTVLILGLALGLILALSSVAFAQVTDKVTVKDQSVVNGTVTIQQVDAAQDGWLTVHAQASGNPGPDLGHAAVKAGTNKNVVVKIDTTKATPVLYAMLHVDLGQKGVYEFPGPDVPVKGAQADVNPTFRVTQQAAGKATTGTTSSAKTTTGTTSSAKTTTGTTSSAKTTTGTTSGAPRTLPRTGGAGSLETALLSLGLLSLAIGFGLTRRQAYQHTKD